MHTVGELSGLVCIAACIAVVLVRFIAYVHSVGLENQFNQICAVVCATL